jgi:hypothetical protein
MKIVKQLVYERMLRKTFSEDLSDEIKLEVLTWVLSQMNKKEKVTVPA